MKQNSNNRNGVSQARDAVAALNSSKAPRWTPPASVDDATQRRQALSDELMQLETKLASRNVTDARGRRLTGREYFAFRDRLMRRKAEVVGDLQRVKAYLRQEHEATASGHAEDTTLLRRAYDLLQLLRKEDVDFDAHELDLIEALGRRIGAL